MKHIAKNTLPSLRTIGKGIGLSLVMGFWCLFVTAETTVLGTYGFVQIELPASGGVNLVGFNFGTGSNGQALEEIFHSGALEQGSSPELADKVYVWDDVSQAYVAYFQQPDGQFYVVSDPSGPAVSVTIQNGDALFLKSADDASSAKQLVLLGSVSMSASTTVSYADTVVFANPYPTTANLNHGDFDWSAATSGPLPPQADQIHIWNPAKVGGAGYQSYFLKSVNGVKLWHSSKAPYALTDPILPVGGGAYYSARASFTNSIIRPFEN